MSQANVKSKPKYFTTQYIVKLAMFTALAYVLYMFVKFPIPVLFPSFLDFQVSDLPALIGGFMLGPLGGCLIIILKCLLKMPFTSTLCVGELADVLIGIAFVLPASLIYGKMRTKKGALIGLSVGAASSTLMAVLANAFVLVPLYVQIYFGGNESLLVGALTPLFPSITWETFHLFYLPLSILPFNLLRCLLSGALTFLLYKRLQLLFKYMFPEKKSLLIEDGSNNVEKERKIDSENDGGSLKDGHKQ